MNTAHFLGEHLPVKASNSGVVDTKGRFGSVQMFPGGIRTPNGVVLTQIKLHSHMTEVR